MNTSIAPRNGSVTEPVTLAHRIDRAWSRVESRRNRLFSEMSVAACDGDAVRAAIAAEHLINLMRRAMQLLAVQKRRGL